MVALLKIGLTGGIGSGKTYVADLWAQWGATVIDTDLIAHQLTAANGAAIDAIRRQFGHKYITSAGALCRSSMRQLVFEQPQQLQALEAILHPLIQQHSLQQLDQAQGPYAVVVVPLLVESAFWLDYVDQVCVVDCDQATQIARVQQRSGLTTEQIKRIIKAQATREQRLAVADHIIINDATTTLEQLTARALQLHQQWCAR